MRRFFTALFVVSLLATAGALYWRAYYPEHVSAPAASAPKARSLNRDADGGASGGREEVGSPSGRQDLALTISILSSVVSALAAVAQAWFTARASHRRP